MSPRKKDPNSRIFPVTSSSVGATVAAFLRGQLPEFSWTQIRKLVQSRHVQINGNLCLDETRRLKEGEVVKYHVFPLAPPPSAEDVEIVYLDSHIVIVNKPAGITSVRHALDEPKPKGKKQRQATLEDLMPEILARRAGKLARSGAGPAGTRAATPRRPLRGSKPTTRSRATGPGKHQSGPGNPIKVFPVHRLDRDTSGLMMFALSTAVEEQLQGMFKVHSVERTYRAVCLGNVRGMTIDSNIARDRGDGIRGSVADDKPGQRAVTHVRPVKGLGEYTLVEVRLETGRTHQIRIHLAEQGHMLCGEKIYDRTREGRKQRDTSGAPRLALHAFRLDFLHPITAKKISVEAGWPGDLEEFTRRLERQKKNSRSPNSKKSQAEHD